MSFRLALSVVLLAAACGGGAEPARQAEATAPGSLPASVPAPELEGGVLIVSPERVHEWQAEGTPLVVIDARDSVQFTQEHLPAAINIPYIDIRPGAQLPPRDARIVVYCSDAQCPISQYAYQSLERLGYIEVYDMRDGLQGWKAAGYPTQMGGEAAPEAGGGEEGAEDQGAG